MSNLEMSAEIETENLKPSFELNIVKIKNQSIEKINSSNQTNLPPRRHPDPSHPPPWYYCC